ncbi:electron transport complex subunit RsxA [Amphritea balenae]|uniref:Ion-translocating oxidoreductase complex subunit A n=1 Tax=Amphritea balenae TaxID=452629 RepID=A0A3P1SM46_9GAMM|nr:electron transport complex subunit RsxA [Amphritea balenae]RRC98019.1 electron transport complex subunit RsxA [Amphritea balenae]GGK66846.1 electron transport complex subunit RnfA [Amphritea balenae]
MNEFFILLLGTALVNNVVLVQFLGLCPFMGVSSKIDSAIGMGLATMFVLTLATAASWLIEHYILLPLEVEFLRILSYILVIAGVVQFIEMYIRSLSPTLYQNLGIFLPLITTNCAVLGVALLNTQQNNSFLQSVMYGIGASLGFLLVLVMFAGLRERQALASTAKLFDGPPIAFITAGLLSMSFLGFSGLPLQ